jgi:hypothetical protein
MNDIYEKYEKYEEKCKHKGNKSKDVYTSKHIRISSQKIEKSKLKIK